MNVLNNKHRLLFFVCFWAFIATISFGQTNRVDAVKARGDIRIMFYNTENLFDTIDDGLTNDEEFLPSADREWTKARYRKKLLNIFKSIAAIGVTEPPEIICLAEVENRKVLRDLIQKTPLEKYPFEIVHYDSPDRRGIDVAMIYRKDKISVISSKPVRITFLADTSLKTRDILYARLITLKQDTIHLYVNHWPSRFGGKKQSEFRREYVANVLKQSVDSVLAMKPEAKIIITGDFNDEPADASLTKSLRAINVVENVDGNALYNLSGMMQDKCKCGTFRYKSEWDMFDQFIVSGSLLKMDKSIHTCKECIHVADFDFLLKEDKKYGGTKPFRTYQGPKYIGGSSDHLPVYLDLFY